jgi:beta-lactamase class A
MLVVGKTAAKQLLAEEKNVTKSSTSQKSKPRIKADPIASTTWNDLSQQINAVIAEHGDLDISVAIIDIATNTSANYGIQDSFAGASTTKVLTAAAYLDAVENGERKLTASINGTTAKQQISNMTNQSDNNAWAALNQNLSYTTIEEYAASIGITSYKAKNNVITASDEALLLQKLYQRALLNEENTTLLLSYMQKTKPH